MRSRGKTHGPGDVPPPMRRSHLLLAVASLLLAAPLAAQDVVLLQAAGPPVAPGATFSVLLQNQSDHLIPYSSDDCVLRVLRTSGELVDTPALPAVGCSPAGLLFPLQVAEIVLQAPNETGTFALLYPFAGRAVLGVDVGGGSAGAPQIVVHPADAVHVETTHAHDFARPGATPWGLANLGAADHAFGPGDRIEILAPGGSVPLSTQTLDALVARAGQVLQVELATLGLAPGPYTVRTTWSDPVAGPTTVTHGVRAAGSGIDLHLPAGHVVPSGGSVRLAVAVADFAAAPVYAIALGVQPGSTPLPGGFAVPLALDGLALASLQGLGGFLVNHVGVVPAATGAFADIQLVHPGLPSVAGLEVRAAAVSFDGSAFGASQPELIRFE